MASTSAVEINAVAVPVNITLEQGTTFRWPITLNTKENNVKTPIDLTDYKARMQIRMRYTDTDPILALDSEDLVPGITFPDAPNGKMEVLITDEQTAAFSFKTAKYDLEVESDTGDVIRLLSGTITVSKEVTR